MTYNFSQQELSDIQINVEKLKGAPWFPIDLDQWDSTIALKAFSRIPTDDEYLAAEVVMQWFALLLINEPVEAIDRLLKDGTYKWDDLKKSLASQEFDFDKVCKTFVNHIDDPELYQYYRFDYLLPISESVQSDQK